MATRSKDRQVENEEKARNIRGSADLRIARWPTASLIPYIRNPRKNDDALGRLVASIQEFGFAVPILARSNGVVIDGHLRLKAAVKLGMSEVPVVLCDDWTEPQVKAFRLLANRSVSWAAWDEDLLALELDDLRTLGMDLALTGFDSREIDALLLPATTGSTDADAVPPIPEQPVSRTGDLWMLGAHRLLCGNCTVAPDVARVLGGKTPNLMTADPPYGVDYRPAWREAALGSTKRGRSTGKVAHDDRADWRDAWQHFPGAVAYVWHAGTKADQVAASLGAAGFEIRAQIVWTKPHFVISRGHYHPQHEPCFYAVRRGTSASWTGDRTQSTVWPIANRAAIGGAVEDASTNHSTQKPIDCMRRPILNHTTRGQYVYDPFVGSGTTLIAAETTGRIGLAIDVDPVYVDVAVIRWQQFTGLKATLDGGAATFDEIAQQRGKGHHANATA